MNDAEWAKWSNSEIARRCGVHHEMVGTLRPKSILADSASISRSFVHHKTGTVSTMKTANIAQMRRRN